MDARWTQANDRIFAEYNKGAIAFKKLDLDTLELHIQSQGFDEAFTNSGQSGSIPYGFVVPKTVTKNDVTYREKSVWVNPNQELNGGVYVHELLHVYSWPLPKNTRGDLSEGLTEYYTRQINWVYQNRGYDRQVADVEAFIKKYGAVEELKKWYFCNRPDFIMKKLNETFIKWRYGNAVRQGS